MKKLLFFSLILLPVFCAAQNNSQLKEENALLKKQVDSLSNTLTTARTLAEQMRIEAVAAQQRAEEQWMLIENQRLNVDKIMVQSVLQQKIVEEQRQISEEQRMICEQQRIVAEQFRLKYDSLLQKCKAD